MILKNWLTPFSFRLTNNWYRFTCSNQASCTVITKNIYKKWNEMEISSLDCCKINKNTGTRLPFKNYAGWVGFQS